jgi:hypothetical protein
MEKVTNFFKHSPAHAYLCIFMDILVRGERIFDMTLQEFINRGVRKSMFVAELDRPLTKLERDRLRCFLHDLNKLGIPIPPVHKYFCWDFVGIENKSFHGKMVNFYMSKCDNLFMGEEFISPDSPTRSKTIRACIRSGFSR